MEFTITEMLRPGDKDIYQDGKQYDWYLSIDDEELIHRCDNKKQAQAICASMNSAIDNHLVVLTGY